MSRNSTQLVDRSQPHFAVAVVAGGFPLGSAFKRLFFGPDGVFGYFREGSSGVMRPVAFAAPGQNFSVSHLLDGSSCTQIFVRNGRGISAGCHYRDAREDAVIVTADGTPVYLNDKFGDEAVGKSTVTGLDDENRGVGAALIGGACRPFAFSEFSADGGVQGFQLLEFPDGFDFGVARSLNDSGVAAGYVGRGGERHACIWEFRGSGCASARVSILPTEENCDSEAILVSGECVYGWVERRKFRTKKRTACVWHRGKCSQVGPRGKRSSEAHAGCLSGDGTLLVVGKRDGKRGQLHGFISLVGQAHGPDGKRYDLNDCLTGDLRPVIDNAFDVRNGEILCTARSHEERMIVRLVPVK